MPNRPNRPNRPNTVNLLLRGSAISPEDGKWSRILRSGACWRCISLKKSKEFWRQLSKILRYSKIIFNISRHCDSIEADSVLSFNLFKFTLPALLHAVINTWLNIRGSGWCEPCSCVQTSFCWMNQQVPQDLSRCLWHPLWGSGDSVWLATSKFAVQTPGHLDVANVSWLGDYLLLG